MIKSDELSNPNSCLNKARDDQWLFVLLDHDAAAPATVRFWAEERIRRGMNKRTDPKILEALEWVARATFEQAQRGGDGHSPEELRQAAAMLKTYAADCFPNNDRGQQHFARAMCEAAAETIERHLNVFTGIAASKTLNPEDTREFIVREQEVCHDMRDDR